MQSTSEEGVRLLLGHAYGIEISNRFCVKTASEVALLARKVCSVSVLPAGVSLSHSCSSLITHLHDICLTQRATSLQYDIPVLLHKADAFLGKAMEDRTTDRLRCKPAFWASQKHGVTDCAMRFLLFAGNS